MSVRLRMPWVTIHESARKLQWWARDSEAPASPRILERLSPILIKQPERGEAAPYRENRASMKLAGSRKRVLDLT
jgi:hypothetical protein